MLTEAEQSKCPYREGLLHWKKLLVGDEMWMREQLLGTGAGQRIQKAALK